MNKKLKIAKIARISSHDVASDIIDDIDGREVDIHGNDYPYIKHGMFSMYKLSSLQTKDKGINETTKLRMDNLRNQLKGFDYFIITL